MSKNLKFPIPNEVKPQNPCAYRSAAIAVQLYNQVKNEDAKKFSVAVQKWFKDEAKKKGWSRVYFPKDYPTESYAGVVFVLFKKDAQVGTS